MTHSRLWTCDPHHRVMKEVTLANRDMGNQVQCVGGGVTLRLWKYDPRYRVWERASDWGLWTCEPGTGSGKGRQAGDCGCVNQVQGLGKGVSLEIVDM